jgi:hypothetical protein
MSTFHRVSAAAVLLTLVLMSAATPAYAFEGREGEKVTVAAGEVVDDDLSWAPPSSFWTEP